MGFKPSTDEVVSAINAMEQMRDAAVEKAKRFESQFGGVSGYRDEVDVYDVALQCMRRRIGIKPQRFQGYEGRCPKCRAVFLDRSTNFCGNCGQRIDWGE